MSTFGYTTFTSPGGLTAGYNSVFCLFPLAEAGDVSKLSARLYIYEGYTGYLKGAIYAADGTDGVPGTLMGVSNPTLVDSTTAADYDFTFAAAVELTAASYYLTLIPDEAAYWYFCRDQGGESTQTWGQYLGVNYASPPATAPTLEGIYTGTSDWYCIYATYTVPSSVPEAPTINAYQSGSNIIVAWS